MKSRFDPRWLQSGEAEGRARTINTALALPVMQDGYLKIYWRDEFKCGDK